MERAVPVTERHPDKSRRGIYRILDHYFRFWFRFVYPNRSLLARGETDQVRREAAEYLDQFVGTIFESICQEHVWRLHAEGTLGFTPRSVGSWWNHRDQIDVVAVGDGDILLGGCKWSVHRVGTDVLEDLRRKAPAAIPGGNHPKIHYALFSRSGFTPDLEAVAAAEGIVLVDLARICR